MKKRKLFELFIFVVLSTFSSFSFADFNSSSTWAYTQSAYIGIQGGYGLTGWDNVKNTANFGEVSGANNLGIRAYIGYDVYRNFAIEAGYTQFFNKVKMHLVNSSNVYEPKLTRDIDFVAKLKAHIIDNFELYAKAGIGYLMTNKGIDNKSHDVFNTVYGAGAAYEITRSFSVDLSWTRYNGDPKWSNAYIPYADLFAFGISYKLDW